MGRAIVFPTLIAAIIAWSCLFWQRQADSDDSGYGIEEGEDESSLMQINTDCLRQTADTEEDLESLLQVSEGPFSVIPGDKRRQRREAQASQTQENKSSANATNAATSNSSNATPLLQTGDAAGKTQTPEISPRRTGNATVDHAGSEKEAALADVWRLSEEKAVADAVKNITEAAAAAAPETLGDVIYDDASQRLSEVAQEIKEVAHNVSEALHPTNASDALRKQKQISRLRDMVGWFSIGVLSVLIVVALCASARRKRAAEIPPDSIATLAARLEAS